MGLLSRVADELDPPATGAAAYYDDPVGFARDCIDWRGKGGLTEYQEEVLGKLVTEHKVAVRGPHGLGKTTEAAIAVLWFATTRDAKAVDWKVVTTASVWRQLTKFLWPEIHKWAKRLRWDVLERAPFGPHELLILSLKLRHGEAFAAASNDHEKIEGAHADSLLYLYDEAKAIPTATFDATEGAFSGAGADTEVEAFALAQSTPGQPAGRFYDIHARKPGYEDWHPIFVTKDRVVAAGRMSEQWAKQRALQWTTGSSLYLNRVEGAFAADDESAVIPLSWVEAANRRWHDLAESGQWGPLTRVSVDVARSGADRTVFAHRHGLAIRELEHFGFDDSTMNTADRVAAIQRGRDPSPPSIVDVIGVGAGVYDRLRQLRLPTHPFTASGRTDMRDESGELGFTNVRSAAWWNLRTLLHPERGLDLALPPDDELTGDLCAPRWEERAGGRIYVESKEDIRERIGRSPDDGDAVVMAFWPIAGPVASAVPTRTTAVSRVTQKLAR